MSSLCQAPRVRASLLWIGCAWLLALPAFAQPRIEWQANAGCPSADDGRAQIERLLRAPLDELAIQLAASVHLRRESGSSFAATIEVQQDGVARTRVLHSPDCAVLAHASAVIVALAIDPTARVDEPSVPVGSEDIPQEGRQTTTNPSSATGVAEAAAGSEAHSPLTAAAVSGETRPDVHAASEDGAARRSTADPVTARGETPAAEGGKKSTLTPYVGAALALNAGTLPQLAPGLTFLAGLETSRSRAALRLTYAPAQRATAEAAPGLAGQVGLYAAAVEAGLHWYLAPLELSSLAGLEAGVFAARGSEGVYDRETKHPFWLGGYLAAGVALLVETSYKIGLRLDGIIALRRPSFVVVSSDLGDERLLHRPNLVSGRAWLELELHFLP